MDALNSALSLIRRILHADEDPDAPLTAERVASASPGGAVNGVVLRPQPPREPDATRREPPRTSDPTPGEQGFDELQDLLDGIGAVSGPDPERELRLKDATIAELSGMLAALRPMGEELALAERARLELVARADALSREIGELKAWLAQAGKELEAERQRSLAEARDAGDDPELHEEAIADLEARLCEAIEAGTHARMHASELETELAEREGMLERERERHGATREKLAERKRVATERWHEIRRLRAELREKG